MSSGVPLFSLAYTSVRPKAIAAVVKFWDERSALHSHEWVISVDDGDNLAAAAATEATYKSVLNNRSRKAGVVVNTGSKDSTTGWNCAAASTTGKVILNVADDFLPPVGWDQSLLNLEPKGWEDGEYVVKTEDGYVHDIFVLSILTRKRYERFGYLFYPKYRSLFSDTEFGDVARRDGVVLEAYHLLFEHLHPDCGKRPRDEADLIHASKERWNSGQMLYLFRKARDFPLDDGPKAVATAASGPPAPENTNFVAYMQVTKDDLCLLEVCHRLVEEGVKDFCFCQPDRYWSGEPVEPEHLAEVEQIAARLREEGLTVHHQKFHVEQFQMPGDTRILIETRVRNASLEWIAKLGYQHILIIDGDELWVKGTLSLVKDYVRQGHKVISCHMIPVIGVPGYPVDFASDMAVIYVAAGVIFKCCRSPYVRQTLVPRPLIYHFTGTRKGMEETVKKHLRGGHFDDPEYDFAGWIKDTLPVIKPGLKNAHMFKPRQIWPVVRAWRKGELETMPEVVRPYLGTEVG